MAGQDKKEEGFSEYTASIVRLVIDLVEGKETDEENEKDLETAKVILDHEYDIKNHLYIRQNSKIDCFNLLEYEIISQRNEDNPIGENSYMKYQELERYLKKISRRFKSIEVDEKRLNGMPVIKNTRIPVSLIVACLKDEMTFGEICEEYKLTREEIETAMEYVIEILDAPYQEG